MTHLGTGLTGAVFLGIAVLGFLYPVNNYGHSVVQVDELCSSGFGQFGQFFSGDLQQACQQVRLVSYGVYGLGLIGIILVIVGVVVPSREGPRLKEKPLTCPYCNFVALSDTDLLKHKTDNHLDKSPYKCEHCNFIGITEEVLWNHYNDKHPDKKKW